MPYSPQLKNDVLTYVATRVLFVGAATADPGTTGANEVTGGSPAYIRKSKTFNAPAAGTMDDSNAPNLLDIPAGVTVTHVTFWDHVSSTGATHFMGAEPLPDGPETSAAQWQLSIDDVDIDQNAA